MTLLRTSLILSILVLVRYATAATWYVDSAATGSQDGTSWANAWTNFYNITNVSPGDTVEISGGEYPAIVGSFTFYETPWGLTNSMINFKHSRTPGHNSLAHITVPLGLQACVNIDGAISDNCETHYSNTWDVATLHTNCGIWIDGTTNWSSDVLTLGGYHHSPPDGVLQHYIYSNQIKWCIISGPTGPYGTIKYLDGIKGPDLVNCRGLEVCYCQITNFIEYAIACGNNETGFGSGAHIHHIDYPYQQDLSTGSLYGGGFGADIHNCLINKFF